MRYATTKKLSRAAALALAGAVLVAIALVFVWPKNAGPPAKPSGPAEAIVSYQASLKELMDKNSDEVKAIGTEMQDGVGALTQALDDAKKGNPRFGAVEDKWAAIEKRVGEAENTLSKIVETADSFFGAEEQMVASIEDKQLHDSTQASVAERKGQFATKLQDVKAKFSEMLSVRRKVHDVVVAIQVQVTLAFVDKQIANLENLKLEVDKIIKDLEALHKEASALVNTI